jgi:beta-lactamase class D
MRALPLFTLALLAACGGKKSTPTVATTHDAGAAFDAARAEPIDISGIVDAPGCFVVRAPDGTVRQSDEILCQKRLLPASTFKVPNALIGAEVGLLDGPDAIMTYDAKAYPKDPDWPGDWGRDMPLREALLISAVPLFRKLAVDIGPERMKTHLDAFQYGNADLTGGQDRFWLTGGGLAISAPEQVAFLARLVEDKLPVKPAAMATVRAAMPTEKAGDATLYWKTGTARTQPEWTAWLVGWVARPDGNHVFACWLADVGDFDQVRSRRMAFCKGVLARLDLFSGPPQTP